MNLQILNPLDFYGWDDLLLAGGDDSFFHTSAWAQVLNESYGYEPKYFTQISDNKLSVLFPVMEVKSYLTGKRGASLPFTDCCRPFVPGDEVYHESMVDIIAHGKNNGWKYFELRGGQEHMGDATPSLSHYTHDLDLEQDEESIFSNLKENTRRNIKKAYKEGVEVQHENSFDSIKEFFRLNCITRKRHGLPPQPFKFFKNIFEFIISKKKGYVSLAVHKRKVIAGAVFFHFGSNAIYKYGASDLNYSHLRPNNLLMWEIIKRYKVNGYKNFSFGITEEANEGLLQFKRSWGAKEGMLNYYKYDFKKESFVKDEFRGRTSYAMFKHMPMPLLKLTGSLIYRHFG